jgi:integrase
LRTKLTDTAIRAAKKADRPYKLADGGGLLLEVRPTGAKLWRYRYRIDGKENVFAGGEYAEAPRAETLAEAERRRAAGRLTLAEARVARTDWADLVRQGTHPAHQRKLDAIRRVRENADTLRVVGAEWLASKDWEQETKDAWERMLKLHVYPDLGEMAVRRIASPEVLNVLKKIEATAPTIAAQAKRALSGIFELAIATLRADRDPVWPVRKAIKMPKPNHRKPLPLSEVGRLLQLVDESAANLQTKIAFRMLWFTLARPNEVLGAPWPEIDLDAAVWRIAPERMKMREPHIVPLPRQAIDDLRKLHVLTGERALLFPNRNDPRRPSTDNTLRVLVRELGFSGIYSPHATRATGSTWLNEAGYRSDLIERQLAHGEKDPVRGSYNFAIHLDERRDMMQRWADVLGELEIGRTMAPSQGRA